MNKVSHILSRILEVTLGGVLGFFGLLSVALGIEFAVVAVRQKDAGAGKLLAGMVMVLIGIPALLYASRMIFPRLRAWHGGIVGHLGFNILGVYFLVLPVMLLLTRQWGQLLIQLIHLGASGGFFALARARRRSAQVDYGNGPAPIRPE